MPAWILALLNPLNWMRLLKLISTLTGLFNQASEWLKNRRVQKQKEEIDQASAQVDESKKNPDDLKGQADALCKLEKATNPNSNCDK